MPTTPRSGTGRELAAAEWPSACRPGRRPAAALQQIFGGEQMKDEGGPGRGAGDVVPGGQGVARVGDGGGELGGHQVLGRVRVPVVA
ncbi:hypothetical protein, partial [Streptomyces sp. WAC01526]|uniref:hypothetical protein n=1 Tax=Streptomyces sp. WAC01526 TaxID=2588709 RepID=UPI0037DC1038